MGNLYSIILAGGASVRFWPLSGEDHPKYLLKPDGEHSLLSLAFARACTCCDASRVIVVTGSAQADRIRSELPGLPAENLCIEPARRDTAAAVALGCKLIQTREPAAQVLVLPADTLLDPDRALAQAVELARTRDDFSSFIHVFGVQPQRPEPGFGYIEPGQEVTPGLHAVGAFHEKPGPERAAEYVAAGRLWNAGCFLFAMPHFVAELRQHLPTLAKCVAVGGPGELNADEYRALEAISIDHGLIEKSGALRVLKLEALFDDLGTWDALANRLEAAGKPPLGAISAGGSGNSAFAAGRIVAVVGLDDVLVVAEGDRILVMKRGAGQLVKEIAALAAVAAEDRPVDGSETTAEVAPEDRPVDGSETTAEVAAEDRPEMTAESGATGSPAGRWIGLDFGTKWIGVAIGDEQGEFAHPLKTLEAKPAARLLKSLGDLARSEGAAGFVVGVAYNMDGSEGPAAKACRAFGAELAKASGKPVEFADERLSSWEAEGKLIEGGLKPSERKKRVHAVAASMILEAFWQSRK